MNLCSCTYVDLHHKNYMLGSQNGPLINTLYFVHQFYAHYMRPDLEKQGTYCTAELSDFSCTVYGINIRLRCNQTDETLTMEGQVCKCISGFYTWSPFIHRCHHICHRLKCKHRRSIPVPNENLCTCRKSNPGPLG